MARGRCYIGTSGYQYDHWRGPFYPPDLPKHRWFAWYAARFDTVEINNTFYRLPGEEVFATWARRAPPGFTYALKFSRYATHIKRLGSPGETVQRFLERARPLFPCLGPILVQLPPRWKPQPERLAAFLEAAPPSMRWAVELRDGRWLREEVFALLRAHGAALCLHDMLPDHPVVLTSNWVYLRYHGDHYGGSYPTTFLEEEARRIGAWLEAGLDVYAYFNNDAQGYAVTNALGLKSLLGRCHVEAG